MDPTSFSGVVELLQGGGNVALVIAVYFIYKAAHRLTRIETMLELIARRLDPKATIPPEINGG